MVQCPVQCTDGRTSEAADVEDTHTRTRHVCHGLYAAGGPHRSRHLLRNDLHYREAAQRRVRCSHRSQTCASPRIWCAPSLASACAFLPQVDTRPGGWQFRSATHRARRVSTNSLTGTFESPRHGLLSRDLALLPIAEKARAVGRSMSDFVRVSGRGWVSSRHCHYPRHHTHTTLYPRRPSP